MKIVFIILLSLFISYSLYASYQWGRAKGYNEGREWMNISIIAEDTALGSNYYGK